MCAIPCLKLRRRRRLSDWGTVPRGKSGTGAHLHQRPLWTIPYPVQWEPTSLASPLPCLVPSWWNIQQYNLRLCEVFSVLVKAGTIYGVHQGVLKSDCFAEPSQLLPAIMQSIIMSFISENRPTWLKFQSVGTRTCRTIWAMPPHPPTRVLPWNTHLLYVDKVTLWPSSRMCISKRNLAKTSKRPVKWA